MASFNSLRLNIVLFNTEISEAGVSAADRYERMDVILNSFLAENNPNLFILAQNKINWPKHTKLCEKLHQDPAKIPCREHAGVYYDTNTNTHYHVSYVNVVDLQQAADAVGYEPCNDFTVARLTAWVLLPIAGIMKGTRILLVSWHGPGRPNLAAKRACFDRLLRFLERLQSIRFCHMVIVGGNFNFPAMKARGMLDGVDGAVLDNYIPTEDQQVRDAMDYVVYWPKDGLHYPDVSVVKRDFRREFGTTIL